MTRPFFSKDRITHFDIFDRQENLQLLLAQLIDRTGFRRHALDAIQQMKSRVKEGYAVDWQVNIMQTFPCPKLSLTPYIRISPLVSHLTRHQSSSSERTSVLFLPAYPTRLRRTLAA